MDNVVVKEKLKEIMDHNVATCGICIATIKRKKKQIRQAKMILASFVMWSTLIVFRFMYAEYFHQKFTGLGQWIYFITHIKLMGKK